MFLAMQVLEIPAGGRGFPLVLIKYSAILCSIRLSSQNQLQPALQIPCRSGV